MSLCMKRTYCVIPTCTVAIRGAENVSMHRFPKQVSRKIEWIEIVRKVRKDPQWEPTEQAVICSRHFQRKDFAVGNSERFRLTSSAKPTQNLPAPVTQELDVNEDLNTVKIDCISGESDSLFQPIHDCATASEIEQTVDVEATEHGETSNAVSGVLSCPSCSTQFVVQLMEGSTFAVTNCIPKSYPTSVPSKARKRLFEENAEDLDLSLPTSSPVSIIVTPRSIVHVKNEHCYSRTVRASPCTAADEFFKLKEELKTYKQLCRNLKEKLERRDMRQLSLQEQLADLESDSQDDSLGNQLPPLLKTIVSNEMQSLSVKSTNAMVYSEEMKKFAATLHFYSPKAYSFVRDYLTLPHPQTISSWMKASDCDPGYNVDVLDRLAKARELDQKNIMTEVNFMIDEMAIRKQMIWDPSARCFVGYVDYGDKNIQVDSVNGDVSLASNALVAMICGQSGGWKVPIGYIYTDKVDSKIQKTFVDTGLKLLEERKFNVNTLISDGNTANVALFELYGIIEAPGKACDELKYTDIVNSFPNPANSLKTIFAVYDVCHMIKLWRNLLAQIGDITLANGKVVSWKYVEQLHQTQTKEKIRAANKLGRNHVDFGNHKMNVRLAVQSLSKSVADSIKFCDQVLKLPEFAGSKDTVDFIYLLDKVFDILNSRHPGQKSHKAPMTRTNINYHATILDHFVTMVLGMRYTEVRKYSKTGKVFVNEKFLVRSARKRAAVGIIVTIKSITLLARLLLFRTEHPFSYIMTYRFSQDLLELFFNKVRGRLGRNNNPSVVEFKHIMKRVWHQNLLKSSNTGNCIEQMQEGEIPGGLLPLKRQVSKVPIGPNVINLDHMDLDSINLQALSYPKFSKFRSGCLGYISGNVALVVGTRCKCETCAEAMLDDELDSLDESLKALIRVKDRGGLITPCKSVYRIVEATEVVFAHLIATFDGKINIPNLDRRVAKEVTQYFVGSDLFPHAREHFNGVDPFSNSNHLCQLIEDISLHFLKIRLFDYGKRYMTNISISTRHTLNKTTLFKNQ